MSCSRVVPTGAAIPGWYVTAVRHAGQTEPNPYQLAKTAAAAAPTGPAPTTVPRVEARFAWSTRGCRSEILFPPAVGPTSISGPHRCLVLVEYAAAVRQLQPLRSDKFWRGRNQGLASPQPRAATA